MITGIFDSHAHYDDEQFSEDFADVLFSLADSGISKVMNAGCDMKSSRRGIVLGKQFDFLYSSVGVHPQAAEEICTAAIDELAELSRSAKVCAIGEIGLDYFYETVPREKQLKAFETQLDLANSLHMPVIIHSRDAAQDTMELLRKHRPTGIVHCYSGSVEMAKEILKLDMYLGFTGVVTFKNARKAAEVVAYAPMDHLLVETDCPYMAPEPYRGRRCDSSMLQQTVAKMAEIKSMSPQAVADVSYQNACRIYGITK